LAQPLCITRAIQALFLRKNISLVYIPKAKYHFPQSTRRVLKTKTVFIASHPSRTATNFGISAPQQQLPSAGAFLSAIRCFLLRTVPESKRVYRLSCMRRQQETEKSSAAIANGT
jgi:hypothetical protein